MELKRCFEILELDRGASLAETRQAYKDSVSVWHPDRFSHNPRLKKRAEEKLKEINVAYETLISFLSSKQTSDSGREQDAPNPGEDEKKSNPGKRHRNTTGQQAGRKESEATGRTEIIAEMGTRIALSLWAYLSSKLRQIAADQTADGEETDKN